MKKGKMFRKFDIYIYIYIVYNKKYKFLDFSLFFVKQLKMLFTHIKHTLFNKILFATKKNVYL